MLLKADLHTHTLFSNNTQIKNWGKFVGSRLIDSKTTVEQLLRQAKKVGLDVLSITDHDEILGYKEASKIAKKYGIVVVTGVEVTTKEGHMLVYGVENVPKYKIETQELIELAHKKGGLVVAAHPFSVQGIFHSKKGKKLFGKVKLDAMEVYSALKGNIDKRSVLYADTNNLPKLAGSDSKTLWSLGDVYTEIEVKDRSTSAILDAIKKGKTKPVVVKTHNPLFYGLRYLYTNYISSVC